MNEQVLVIDDEQDSVDGICTNLKIEGISCRGETNPSIAIESFSANPTDVVIVDYLLTDLHGITGLDVISQLKDIKPYTRFILISAVLPKDDEQIAKEISQRMYVDEYVSKPLNIENLINLVNQLLGNIESTAEDWVAISKEHVAKGSIPADQVRELNEKYKQSILEAFERQDEE